MNPMSGKPKQQGGALMNEVEAALSGRLPEPQQQLSAKLHTAAIDLLHGDMNEKTVQSLSDNREKLPPAMAQISAGLIEALQSKIGGGLPIGVLVHLTMMLTIELIEICQAMKILEDNDDVVYPKIIPQVLQLSLGQLSGQAKKRGVVTPAHMQEAQQISSQMQQGRR